MIRRASCIALCCLLNSLICDVQIFTWCILWCSAFCIDCCLLPSCWPDLVAAVKFAVSLDDGATGMPFREMVPAVPDDVEQL